MRVSQPRLRPQLRKTLQMATEQEDSIRLLRRALVIRVKYWVQEEKERIPLSILGVHPFNRAGLNPMEEKVMSVGLSILSGGFSVDEASHEGVCVQEIPHEEQQSAQWFQAMKYDTYLAYNKNRRSCGACDYFQQVPFHSVWDAVSQPLASDSAGHLVGGQMAYQGEQQGRRPGQAARS